MNLCQYDKSFFLKKNCFFSKNFILFCNVLCFIMYFMNWLIIAEEEDQDFFKEIVHQNFYGNVVYVSDTKKKNLEKILDVLDCITHFVYCGEKLFSATQFLCGFFCGKNIPVYLCGLEDSKFVSAFENCTIYGDKDDFSSYLKQNYESVIADFEAKENASSSSAVKPNLQVFMADVFSGDFDGAISMIAAGFDVNSTDDQGIPLINLAVRKGNKKAVQFLLDNGALINSISEDRGYTPLMDAIFCGFDELAIYLSKVNGSDVNVVSKEGQTAIVLAVGSDKIEVCKALVERGADVDFCDSMGMSAYGYASLFKKSEIASVLEKYHKE